MVAVVGLIGIVVRQVVPWAKQANDADALFRADLLMRIGNLERDRDRERARHEVERRALHHELGNVNQCFDALLLLIEAAPEKAREHVKKIKEMRAAQKVAEAAEKGQILAAEITAYGEEAAT